MALQGQGQFEDDGFWDVETPAATPAASSYAGPIPKGYSHADVEDFLRRNPGDEHRVGEALTPPPSSPPATFTFANGGGSSAPATPSPFGAFAFDASKAGQSEGFKFKFDKAMQAIQRLGAAKGTYFNPQTTDAAQAEAVGLANQDLNDEFSRQAGVYDRNFGTHTWNEGSRFDAQRSNRLDDFGMMDTDRRFNRGVLESDRDFGYRGERDRMGDMWRFVDYGYGAGSLAR